MPSFGGEPLLPRPVGPPDRQQPQSGARLRGLRIGRIAGIPVFVHWTFPLLIVFAALVSANVRAFEQELVWIGVVFACVVAHELSHSVVARHRGVNVLGILLLPIGGVSELEQLPESSSGELAIAAAGPAMSVLIGLVVLALGATFGSRVWPPGLFGGSWFGRVGWLNLLLAAFNMLPAIPMDGGRVLRAALVRHHDRAEATRLAANVARVVAYVMLAVGFVYDVWLILIAIFVLLGAEAERNAAASGPDRPRPPGR